MVEGKVNDLSVVYAESVQYVLVVVVGQLDHVGLFCG